MSDGSGSVGLEDRVEELETKVEGQAAQSRLFWALFVYGVVTIVLLSIVPLLGLIVGAMGLFGFTFLALMWLL